MAFKVHVSCSRLSQIIRNTSYKKRWSLILKELLLQETGLDTSLQCSLYSQHPLIPTLNGPKNTAIFVMVVSLCVDT